MSRFETEFVKPMNEEIQRKVRDVSATLVADTATEVFEQVLRSWPADTFWSAANHRINVGPNPPQDFPLEPPTRPKESGALINEAEDNAEEQLAKLNGVGFGDRVLIGNAVPYAANVGYKPSNGTRIYIEAAAIGSEIISSRIG